MALVSAGCLVTREGPEGVEVLLVHPNRSTFRRPVFGIPKGLVEAGEEHETAASRETLEETGLHVKIIGPLGSVRQKSGKVVYAFHATIAQESVDGIDELGRCRFPDSENDVCRFYPIAKAYNLMIPAQRDFLDRLQGLAVEQPAPSPVRAPRRTKVAKAKRRARV